MTKIGLSAKIEISEFNKLKGLADRTFHGNMSNALDWILRSTDIEEFYRNMARYHAQQLFHCREVCETLQQQKPKKEEQTQLEMPQIEEMMVQ